MTSEYVMKLSMPHWFQFEFSKSDHSPHGYRLLTQDLSMKLYICGPGPWNSNNYMWLLSFGDWINAKGSILSFSTSRSQRHPRFSARGVPSICKLPQGKAYGEWRPLINEHYSMNKARRVSTRLLQWYPGGWGHLEARFFYHTCIQYETLT